MSSIYLFEHSNDQNNFLQDKPFDEFALKPFMLHDSGTDIPRNQILHIFIHHGLSTRNHVCAHLALENIHDQSSGRQTHRLLRKLQSLSFPSRSQETCGKTQKYLTNIIHNQCRVQFRKQMLNSKKEYNLEEFGSERVMMQKINKDHKMKEKEAVATLGSYHHSQKDQIETEKQDQLTLDSLFSTCSYRQFDEIIESQNLNDKFKYAKNGRKMLKIDYVEYLVRDLVYGEEQELNDLVNNLIAEKMMEQMQNTKKDSRSKKETNQSQYTVNLSQILQNQSNQDSKPETKKRPSRRNPKQAQVKKQADQSNVKQKQPTERQKQNQIQEEGNQNQIQANEKHKKESKQQLNSGKEKQKTSKKKHKQIKGFTQNTDFTLETEKGSQNIDKNKSVEDPDGDSSQKKKPKKSKKGDSEQQDEYKPSAPKRPKGQKMDLKAQEENNEAKQSNPSAQQTVKPTLIVSTPPLRTRSKISIQQISAPNPLATSVQEPLQKQTALKEEKKEQEPSQKQIAIQTRNKEEKMLLKVPSLTKDKALDEQNEEVRKKKHKKVKKEVTDDVNDDEKPKEKKKKKKKSKRTGESAEDDQQWNQ